MTDATGDELQLLRARVANLERFASRLAHELSTPLVTARGFASLLLDSGSWDTPTRDALERIEQAAARAEALVRDRLENATSDVAVRVDVRRVLADAASAVRDAVPDLAVDLELGDIPDDTFAFAMPAVTVDAFAHALRGLAHRTEGSGEVTVRGRLVGAGTDSLTVELLGDGPAYDDDDERTVVHANSDDPGLDALSRAARLVIGQGGRMWCHGTGTAPDAAATLTVALPRFVTVAPVVDAV